MRHEKGRNVKARIAIKILGLALTAAARSDRMAAPVVGDGARRADAVRMELQMIGGETQQAFNASAKANVAIQDFGSLLAPNGSFDKFFNDYFVPFEDTIFAPRYLKRVKGVDMKQPIW